MKQRVIFRFSALLLCAVLLLPFFPAGSIAEAQRAEEGKVTILSEIESERTAFEKHYLLSNGSYCAVSYPEAVHEQDESGRWVDVDNTPVYSAASAAHKVTGKTYGATFDSKSGNATLLDKNGKSLSWHYELLGSRRAAVAADLSGSSVSLSSGKNPSPKGKSVKDKTAFELPRAKGSLHFEKAFESVNAELSYTVSPQKIKEDVILNQKGAVSALAMVVENCTYTAELSGAVVLFKDKSGKVAFKVNAPYMYDAAGADSTDVAVAVEQKGTAVTITYTPSASWLNADERVYPVTFDPAVTTNDYQANIEDSYVIEGNTTDYSAATGLHVGTQSGKNYTAYLRVNDLPDTGSLPVLGAELAVTAISINSYHTGKTLQIEEINYTGAFSNLPGTTSFGTTYLLDSHTIEDTSDTSYQFNVFNTRFIAKHANGQSVCYRISFADAVQRRLTLGAVNYSSAAARPLLTVYYGYENPSFVGQQIFLNNLEPTGTTNRKILKMTGTTLSMVAYNVNEARAAMTLVPTDNGVRIQAVYEGNYLDAAAISAGSAVSGSATGDEWLVRSLSYDKYLISPAANPALALTRTSSGITLQSVGAYDEADQCWLVTNVGTTGQSDGRTVADGVYYIKNLLTRTFMVKNSSSATAPNLTSGMESTLGDKIAWNITFIGNGLYMIESVLSPGYYLHASAAGASLERITEDNIPLKAKFRIIGDGTGNHFIKSATNHYLAASTSSDTAIATTTSSTAGDRIKWNLLRRTYSIRVKNFYDEGMVAKYGSLEEARDSIYQSETIVFELFLQLFEIDLEFSEMVYYESTADHCKNLNNQEITSSSIHNVCENTSTQHTINYSYFAYMPKPFEKHCNDTLSCMYDFYHNQSTSSEICILWSGHDLYWNNGTSDPDVNRSCAFENCILLTASLTADTDEQTATTVLFHELCHTLGASDHYCTTRDDSGCGHAGRCNNPNHTPDPDDQRPDWCVMSNLNDQPSGFVWLDITDRNLSNILCPACVVDINNWLEEEN